MATFLPAGSDRHSSSTLAEDPFDLIGDLLDGQFRVLAVAGQGDLSIVYRGRHEGIDVPVAIKCLDLPSTLDAKLFAPLIESFREGARLHYRLAQGHLHIVQSLGLGTTLVPRTGSVVPYLVREWLEGQSLASDLAARRAEGIGGRGLAETMALLESAVDALAYAHAQGVVHHWLNPGNLFVVPTTKGKVIKLLDFGVARMLNEHSVVGAPPEEANGLRVLPPTYAAPEQLDRAFGDPGPATDVYALALIFYEMLCGRSIVPPGAVVMDVLHDMRHAERPRAGTLGISLPPEIEAVLSRALALSPGERHPNARAFWDDLVRAASVARQAKPLAPPAQVPARAPPPQMRGVPTRLGLHPMQPPPLPPRPVDRARSGSVTEQAAPPVSVPVSREPPVAPPPPAFPKPHTARTETSSDPATAWPQPARSDAGPESDREPLRTPLAQLRSRAVGIGVAIAAAAALVLVVRSGSSPTSSASAHPARSVGVRAPPAPRTLATPLESRGRLTSVAFASSLRTSPGPFDGSLVHDALDDVAAQLETCAATNSGPRGPGSIRIRIEPKGRISRLQLGPPYVGTAVGACIAKRFVTAEIPPFTGGPRVMNYVFRTIPF